MAQGRFALQLSFFLGIFKIFLVVVKRYYKVAHFENFSILFCGDDASRFPVHNMLEISNSTLE